MPSKTAATPKGPALTFDPRYVDFVIKAWRKHDLAPMTVEHLVRGATEYAEVWLTKLNEMGLLEEEVSQTDVSKVITLLKTLKLAKQTQTGSRGATVAHFSTTAEGRTILNEEVATGGVRPRLVNLLATMSPELTALLRALNERGPLIQPVLSPGVSAPRKGAAYTRAIGAGLSVFRSKFLQLSGDIEASAHPAGTAAKVTAKQLLDSATAMVRKHHPVGGLKQLDKVLPLAEALGLLWTDVEQLDEVIAAQYVGAATIPVDAGYAPYAPTWETVGSPFVDALVQAQRGREDSTGFATIQALRGALGRVLHISPQVVDELICRAREAGERQEVPIAVHFEEDEEQMYIRQRRPLVWRGHAFDFVEVKSKVPATHHWLS